MAILLILCTILYASLDSLLYSNFTAIGNQEGHFFYFFIWTFSIATYFLIQSTNIFKKHHFSFRYQKLLATYVYLSCILTPIIPYTNTNPFLDDLHVLLIMSSVFIFLGIWFYFIYHLKVNHHPLISKIEVSFILFVHLLAFIFLFFSSINSLIEVLIIAYMIIFIEIFKKN